MTQVTKPLYLACSGATKKDGGMNLSEFKKKLKQVFPTNAKHIGSINTRKELEIYCRRSGKINGAIKDAGMRYFKEGVPLDEHQKKYCRCIAKVASQNKRECNKEGKWKSGKRDKGCVNMFAICTKSTKRTGRVTCAPYYDVDTMPFNELRALADMKGMSVAKYKKFVKSERV